MANLGRAWGECRRRRRQQYANTADGRILTELLGRTSQSRRHVYQGTQQAKTTTPILGTVSVAESLHAEAFGCEGTYLPTVAWQVEMNNKSGG